MVATFGVVLAVAAAIGSFRVVQSASGELVSLLRLGYVLGIATFATTMYLVVYRAFGVHWGAVVPGTCLVLAAALWNMAALSRRSFGALLIVIGMVLLSIIAASDAAGLRVDVTVFQEQASRAIFDGVNPYAIRFADVSPDPLIHAPSLVSSGTLTFGFPYPPASLAVVAPFEVAAGDFRIAQSLAILATGWMIAALRPGRIGRCIASVFLLASPALWMSAGGWTEPLLMAATMLVLLLVARGWSGRRWAVGLAASLKQYAIILLPVSLLLVERPWTLGKAWRHLWPSALVITLTAVPFMAWGWRDFLHSVVSVQFQQPFRADSLALPVLSSQLADIQTVSLVTVGQAIGTIAVLVGCLARAKIGGASFALASGSVLATFFILSKQAFPSYFSAAIALLFAGTTLLVVDRADEGPADRDLSMVPVAVVRRLRGPRET